MKFIVDAQLPKSLSDLINSKGFDSIHTLSLPLKNKTSDSRIREIAIEENRIVITKDDDFLSSHLLFNSPPKLIIVKTGNILNRDLLKVFETFFPEMLNSLQSHSLIELHRKEIVIHD